MPVQFANIREWIIKTSNMETPFCFICHACQRITDYVLTENVAGFGGVRDIASRNVMLIVSCIPAVPGRDSVVIVFEHVDDSCKIEFAAPWGIYKLIVFIIHTFCH